MRAVLSDYQIPSTEPSSLVVYEPAIVAFAALAIAGSVMSTSAANSQVASENAQINQEAAAINKSQEDAFNADQDALKHEADASDQQQDYTKQKEAEFSSVQQPFNATSQNQQLQDAAAARLAAGAGTTVGADPYQTSVSTSSPDAPRVVTDAVGKSINDALQFGKQQVGALANIGAWGDNQAANQQALTFGGLKMNTIANNAQGAANLLPFQQAVDNATIENANNINAFRQQKAQSIASRPIQGSGFGDLLKTAGSVGLSATGGGTSGPSWDDLFGGSGAGYGAYDSLGYYPTANGFAVGGV